MSDQETAILIAALLLASMGIILLNIKQIKGLFMLMLLAIGVVAVISFLDEDEPNEPNQTILEQQREKWRDDKEEKVNGSRD
jgi:cadmium resistance protein CadD (predicted permease)